MKLALPIAAGFILGAAASLGALYVNPLTSPETADIGRFDRTLSYDFPREGTLLLTHAGRIPLPIAPTDVQALWESTIRSSAMAVSVLSDDGTPAALATRISVPSRADLLSDGIVVRDHWLITIAGEGTLLVLGDSNVWPLLKDHVLPVAVLGREWAGPREHRTTHGPGVRGTAIALGATGRLAALDGSAVEQLRVERFSRAEGFERVSAELHLRLVPPPAAQAPAATQSQAAETTAADAP